MQILSKGKKDTFVADAEGLGLEHLSEDIKAGKLRLAVCNRKPIRRVVDAINLSFQRLYLNMNDRYIFSLISFSSMPLVLLYPLRLDLDITATSIISFFLFYLYSFSNLFVHEQVS